MKVAPPNPRLPNYLQREPARTPTVWTREQVAAFGRSLPRHGDCTCESVIVRLSPSGHCVVCGGQVG